MVMISTITVTILAFISMEIIAWASHKYLMHGWLWYFHEDHHKHNTNLKPFERNDFFFLLFALPGILLIFHGYDEFIYTFFIGLGITLYGFSYFMIHDVFIHRRIKWFRNTKSFYLKGIRKAHKAHHKHLDKEEGECFGMLWVPIKFFKK